jgi:hypothetical protein
MDLSEFEKLWQQVDAEGNVNEQGPDLDKTTPEYAIHQAVARYTQLCNILAVYYHAVHGEPMVEFYNTDTENDALYFDLTQSKDK